MRMTLIVNLNKSKIPNRIQRVLFVIEIFVSNKYNKYGDVKKHIIWIFRILLILIKKKKKHE